MDRTARPLVGEVVVPELAQPRPAADPPGLPAATARSWAATSRPGGAPAYLGRPAFVTGLTRAAAIAMACALTVAAIRLPGSRSDYPLRLTIPLLAVLTVPSAWLAVRARRAATDLRPVQLCGVAAYLTMAVHLLWGPHPLGMGPPSPLIAPLLVGAAAVIAGFGPAPGAGAAALLSGAMSLPHLLDGRWIAATGGFLVVFGPQLLGATLLDALIRESDRVAAAQAALDEASARDRIAAAITRSKRAQEDLVHNHVLAALLAAAAALTPRERAEAAAQARMAQHELIRAAAPGPPDWPRLVRAQAERLGLTVRLTHRGTIHDPLIGQALLDATHEALLNIRRHAGVRVADIAAEFAPDAATVQIRDSGVGFDPAAGSERHGLARVIVDRISDLGGQVHLDSAPGQGTSLTMTIPMATPDGPLDSPNLVWHRVLLGACLVSELAYALLALPFHAAYAFPFPLPLIVGICGLTIWVWRLPLDSRSWPVGLAAITLALTLAVLATQDAGRGDWRTWYYSAAVPVFLVTALHFRSRAAVVTAILQAPLFAVLVRWTEGHWAWGPALLSAIPPVVWAVIGSLLRQAFVRTTTESVELDRLARRHREAIAASAAQGRERRQWLALVGSHCGPLLNRIAAGHPLGDAERTACRRTELGLRDRLRHPGLVSARVLRELDAARRRGVEVVIHADCCPPELVPALAQALMITARAAGAGHRVVVTAYPGPGAGGEARITISGDAESPGDTESPGDAGPAGDLVLIGLPGSAAVSRDHALIVIELRQPARDSEETVVAGRSDRVTG